MKGEISEEALLKYSQLAAESLGLDFSEGEDTYDFTRCVRPDGSAYGTRGKCRKGTEGAAAAKPQAGPKTPVAPTPPKGARFQTGAARREGLKKMSHEELHSLHETAMSPSLRKAIQEEQKRRQEEKKAKSEAKAADLESTKGKMKAGRAGYLGEKAAKIDRGPHYDAIRQAREELKGHLEELKSRKQRMKEAEAAAKANEKRHKQDPSRENKARVKEAYRQLAEHDRHVRRQEKVADKAHRTWAKLHERNERAKMSPAQRAEAKRIDALIREHG